MKVEFAFLLGYSQRATNAPGDFLDEILINPNAFCYTPHTLLSFYHPGFSERANLWIKDDDSGQIDLRRLVFLKEECVSAVFFFGEAKKICNMHQII